MTAASRAALGDALGDNDPRVVRLALDAMGTRFELALPLGNGDAHPPRDLRAAGEAAFAEISELDRRWSVFRRDSLLAFIEREAPRRPVPLDADAFELLRACMGLWRESGGLFDITVGGAMERWGFRDSSGARLSDVPSAPLNERTDTASEDGGADQPAAPPDSSAILLDEATSTIRFTRDDVRLDLGGIAKGHAIDQAVAVLRECGITSALLHGGTSAVAAIGRPTPAQRWRVGVRHPLTEDVAFSVELEDAALAVSAPHGRRVNGHGHIIDPRSGSPAETALLALVAGPCARECDGWTKPVLIGRRRPLRLPPAMSTVVLDPTGGVETTGPPIGLRQYPFRSGATGDARHHGA